MKLCIDCKWSKKPDGFVVGNVGPFLRCGNPKTKANIISPVDGSVIEGVMAACEFQRDGSGTGWLDCRLTGLCGREGRWFEPQ